MAWTPGHGRRRVETAQRGIAPRFGDRKAGRDVFGKARRIRRGEAKPAFAAVGARHQPDRAFGGDVDRVRPDLLDSRRNERGRSAARAEGSDRSASGRNGIPAATGTGYRRRRLRALRASASSVRTTPLTCGCHASVATSTRITAPPSQRRCASPYRVDQPCLATRGSILTADHLGEMTELHVWQDHEFIFQLDDGHTRTCDFSSRHEVVNARVGR